MTPSKVSQPLNNVQLPAQNGGGTVAQGDFTIHSDGVDALIGVSASAWAANGGTPISIEVWVDGQPTGQKLGLTAKQGSMHLSLGHTWARCDGLSSGQHTIELIAGANTITDQNDFACATVWELGDGMALRFDYDAPSPSGTGQTLVKDAFETKGGRVLFSMASSGWIAGTAEQGMGCYIVLGAPAQSSVIFANNSGQDLATVPADWFTTPQARGQHFCALMALPSTSTDSNDIAHLTILEWVDPSVAPVVLAQLQQSAQSQHGDGGSIGSQGFSSSGGTLLVRASASAWAGSTDLPLQIGIQVDGTSHGFLNVFANPATTHMPLVTNNLVLSGIPAGNHTLNLIGEVNTITDQNDYVSALVMEFPQS